MSPTTYIVTLIVAYRKAAIGCVADNPDVREQLLELINALIGPTIINGNDFQIVVCQATFH
jgi:hypothetical protein